jgi:voltage-gated potassium channel
MEKTVEKPKGSLHTFNRYLGLLNDFLLIPMFASIIMEGTGAKDSPLGSLVSEDSNLFFCSLFFTEWLLGFILAPSRKEYLLSFTRILDLVSTIPIGPLAQGARVFRLVRVIKLFRLVIRAKRYQGPGKNLFRVMAVVGATTFAGGYTMLIVEGGTNPEFSSLGDTLWWSLVTVSTVGYGDKFPITGAGRIVAVFLILIGVGVCGYIAGFMTTLMSMDEEDTEKKNLKRIENKLDRLAVHLEVDDWDFQDDEQHSVNSS